MSLNKLHLIGNVGKDPETHTFNSGDKVTKFSLATTESSKNKQGEKVEDTQWHNILCFSHLAEFAEKWIKKGSQLYIEGKIKYKKYEKDGQTKYFTEIEAKEIQFVGKKSDNHEPENTAQTETTKTDYSANGGQEIDYSPF